MKNSKHLNTDDPRGTGGWTKGVMRNLPHTGPQSRELEPG